MENQPYLGITGFMSPREVKAILEMFPPDSRRKLMVGVLASEKTMGGKPNMRPNRYADRFAVEHIFQNNPVALNLVHYNTKNVSTLVSQMAAFAELFGGPNFQGYQLNVAWPPPAKIEAFCEPGAAVIVLQAGGRALERVGHSPRKLADRVAQYKGLVQYLLIDPSGGRGQAFDTERARVYLREIAERDLGIMLGVAGGLCAETLYLVRPLLEEFPDLSIDAEGRLRDEEDNLDLDAAKRYASAALGMFGR